MTLRRRIAIGAIILAAALTALLGGAYVVVALFSDHGEPAIAVVFYAAAGIAAVVTGARCAHLAARDIRPARLSERTRRWTWWATLAFTALWAFTFWWIPIALLAPLVTSLCVRTARGPTAPPAPGVS